MANKTKLMDLRSNLRELNVSQFGGQQLVKHKLPAYEEGGKNVTQVSARVDDLQRISKLLTQTPQGGKFITNLSLLEKFESRQDYNRFRDQGRTVAGSLLRNVAKDIANTAGAVGSALAQTPVNGTGTHFILGLTRDSYLQSGADNPLSRSQLGQFLRDIGVAGNVNAGAASLRGETINAGPNNVVSRLEGRESEFGPQPTGTPKFNNAGDIVKFLGDIIPQASVPLGETPEVDPDSKSKFVVNGKAVTEVDGKSLSDKNAQAVNFANDRNVRQAVYTVRQKDGKDELYSLADTSLLRKSKIDNRAADYVQSLAPTEQFMEEKLKADIIPFQFTSITPETSTFLYFRAFLDSMNDSFNGNWNATKYVGRAENFYRYSGFDRNIDFSFKIAATSQTELKPLYQKLNLLAGTTAPTYDSRGIFMRGTLTEVTIGDYLKNQKGFISAINLSWNVDYPWEINIYDNPDTLIVPHVLDVSVTFTPIHDFNVKSNIDYSGVESYFGLKKVPKPTETEREKVSSVQPQTGTVEVGQGEFGISPDTGRDFGVEGGIDPPGQMSPSTQRFFDAQYVQGGTTPPNHVPSAGLIKGDASSFKIAYPNG